MQGLVGVCAFVRELEREQGALGVDDREKIAAAGGKGALRYAEHKLGLGQQAVLVEHPATLGVALLVQGQL